MVEPGGEMYNPSMEDKHASRSPGPYTCPKDRTKNECNIIPIYTPIDLMVCVGVFCPECYTIVRYLGVVEFVFKQTLGCKEFFSVKIQTLIFKEFHTFIVWVSAVFGVDPISSRREVPVLRYPPDIRIYR